MGGCELRDRIAMGFPDIREPTGSMSIQGLSAKQSVTSRMTSSRFPEGAEMGRFVMRVHSSDQDIPLPLAS